MLDFLSSITITQNNAGESTFYFRIEGVEQELIVLDLADLFGLTDSGEGMDYCQHPSQIWPLISGEHLTNLQNLVLKKVHHPAIRIWFKSWLSRYGPNLSLIKQIVTI